MGGERFEGVSSDGGSELLTPPGLPTEVVEAGAETSCDAVDGQGLPSVLPFPESVDVVDDVLKVGQRGCPNYT